MFYIQLVNFKEDDYHVKVASDVKEVCELVKLGFQYITGEYNDGGKIFRKPKVRPYQKSSNMSRGITGVVGGI